MYRTTFYVTKQFYLLSSHVKNYMKIHCDTVFSTLSYVKRLYSFQLVFLSSLQNTITGHKSHFCENGTFIWLGKIMSKGWGKSNPRVHKTTICKLKKKLFQKKPPTWQPQYILIIRIHNHYQMTTLAAKLCRCLHKNTLHNFYYFFFVN